MATPQVPKLPPDVYAIFCAPINQETLQKILTAIATASQNNVKQVHLLFQSTGGTVADGVALYNFLRNAPIDITLYNVGSVQSVAAIAYLGAKKRKASARATFVFHRVTGTAQSAQAGTLETIANGVVIDDTRTESIMREHINIPNEKWAILDRGDLWFTADDAIAAKIADEIAEFAPPIGSPIFNL